MKGIEVFSRLPTSVVPTNYNVWLKPCLDNFVFHGKVDVTVDVKEAVSQVELNCIELQISSATFHQKDLHILEAISINYDETNERVCIKFDRALNSGEGMLSIQFNGILNDKTRGFYRNQHVVNGTPQFGAATQFESTDARRCFPCWDEPALKATFDVTLVVLKDMVALSNTNIVYEGEYLQDSKFKVVKYATSPLMSTYLVCFVIGVFDYVGGCTNRSIPVKVYVPKGGQDQGKFALDVAIKGIEFYEEYFKIPYPLPKIDLVALANFPTAMENWGLITFKERFILVDNENTSSASLRYIALVICHELGHMWFGNLVTMEWWTHLWLKEGFCNFMEHVATDNHHPELDVWTYFVCNDHKKAKDLDALESSHPIEVPVQNPNEICEIYDAISYSKGATIIRMLQGWVGSENFRKGTHEYLTRHLYDNASTEDLWDALGDSTGMPVREVMSTWTRQKGYPVVNVSVKSKNSERISLQLVQQKFMDPSRKDSTNPLWHIPLTLFTTKSTGDTIKKLLMKDETLDIVLDNVCNGDWIKLNHSYHGFYRVRYDEQLLPPLLNGVKTKQFSSHDRLNIQNDLFALAEYGISSTVDFVSSLKSYKYETDYGVWNDLDSNIESVSFLLRDKSIYTKFKSYVLGIYENIAEKLGWESPPEESHSDSMLRGIVMRRLGIFGSPKVIDEARKRLDDHISGIKPVAANLRQAVYSTVLAHSRADDLEKMIQLHDTVDLHEDRVRIESCLGYVEDTSQLSKALNFAMSDKVQDNDRVSIIVMMARSSFIGQSVAWEFVKSNWSKLHELYNRSFLLTKLVKMSTENFSSDENLVDVRDFFADHPVPSAERGLQQSVESIEKNISWWKRDGESLQKWINSIS